MRTSGIHHPQGTDALRAKTPEDTPTHVSAKVVQHQRGTGADAVDSFAPVRAVKRGIRKTEQPREMTFVFDAGPRPVSNVTLQGSWNKQTGRYSAQWGSQGVPMQPIGDNKWSVTVKLLDDGQKHDWEWGVLADTPSRKQHWVVYGGNRKFDLGAGTASYSPTAYHTMGARKAANGDLTFRLWLPGVQSVTARITSRSGEVTRVPMTLDGEDWSGTLAAGFAKNVGSSYVYEIVDRDGGTRTAADPYAFEVMGEQRGLSRSYFDPTTGAEVHQFMTPRQDFMRFETRGVDAANAYVILKDGSGRPLSRDEVVARIGQLAPEVRQRIVEKRGVDDLASVTDDGRIPMRFTDGAWTVLVQNPAALAGLRYEIQRGNDVVKDAWSDAITPTSGLSYRDSIIADGVGVLGAHAPAPMNWNEANIYQIHVGSFFSTSNNSRRSTLEDVITQLDYLKSLDVTTLELLPVNEVEGIRDWGYLGVTNMAIEMGLGFEREGEWVSGREALEMLASEAHKRGINLVSDVVYNHALADGNPLKDLAASNPYYNWGTPEHPTLRETPWGPMPAFNNPRVRQYLIDHATSQVLEHGFDGLRFDFTQPIYEAGGKDGMQFLIELVQQVRDIAPDPLLIPEDFSYREWIVNLMGRLWYTEFQHRLVHDHNLERAGLVQAAGLGRKLDIDAFMKLFTNPIGLPNLSRAITMISNHDEVGNALRTIMVAQGENPSEDPPQRARALARLTMLVGQMSPGIPFFFQGDEFGATNKFLWGRPSTWDLGWSWRSLGQDWNWRELRFDDTVRASYERLFALGEGAELDPAFRELSDADKQVFRTLAAMDAKTRRQAYIDIGRRQIFECTKASIAARRGNNIGADVPAKALYAHNDDGVMAFQRGDDHVVIADFKDGRDNYVIHLPPGRWREIHNTDEVRFGGRGNVNGDTVFQGNAHLRLPAAGALVLQRVRD